jgi:DNA-binding CsgD family transcriptional regulator
MRKQKLLQRLVAALATNEGVQPKRTEIWERLKSLTPREVDVLCYVLGGQLNREIAAELGITERTIKVHRGHVMEKLGVQSTAQLFPMVLRVLRESGCKILEDIKELGRETAASNRRQKTPTLEQGLAIQEFLKKQRRAKPRIALRGKGFSHAAGRYRRSPAITNS